jgi:hypothetical protein
VTVTPDAPPPLLPLTGMIEIELPRGYCVRVGCGVTVAALRRVLDALKRRRSPSRRACASGWRSGGPTCGAG